MRYYKTVSGGYILSIGMGKNGGEEITKQEYERIESVIRAAPAAPDGYAYRLTEKLEWELIESEQPDDMDISAEEALEIIIGGKTA